MPKTKVSEWDTTAGNNSDVGGINIAENCPAANVNNAMREIMAQIADVNAGNQTMTYLRTGAALSNLGATEPRAVFAWSDPGQSFTYSAVTELVVARQSSVGMTLATDAGGSCAINFADAAAEGVGGINYDHSNDQLGLKAGGVTYATLSAGELKVNDRVNIEGTGPELLLDDTDAGVDEGIWRIATDPDQIFFQTRTDANGAGQNYHVVTRSGTAITQQDFSANGLLQFRLSSGGVTLASGATVNTIETTLTDDDTHLPTSGAVVDYVASELAGISDATVLLGTITAAGASSYSLTSLDLTPYKHLWFVVDALNVTAAANLTLNSQIVAVYGGNVTQYGHGWVNLATGVGSAIVDETGAAQARVYNTSISTATTTLTFAESGAGNMNSGTIRVFGVK